MLSHTCIHYKRTVPQPEAEDLKLRSGTWSQSHLGPQILLCSPQSGLILCSTEGCRAAPSCLPVSTYKCTSRFMCPFLFRFHGLKGSPGRSRIGRVFWKFRVRGSQTEPCRQEGGGCCGPEGSPVANLKPAWTCRRQQLQHSQLSPQLQFVAMH